MVKIKSYYVKGDDSMAIIVSFINLKGGVGKTTTAVNIASILAETHEMRVLVIDLDPQTNATISLIDQKRWYHIDQVEKQTIFYMFNDLLENKAIFDINRAIIRDVSGIPGLDLLPSSLGLVEIQDYIPDIGQKAYINHVDVLADRMAPILKSDIYDYIIIDCPPNLGAITLNGILISDYYMIPTIPDILSKIGISLVTNRIHSFKERKKACKIELAGIVFTKVDYRTNLHKATMEELRRSDLSSYVFDSEIPQRISISEAPSDNVPFIVAPSVKIKSDFKETSKLLRAITNEFIDMTE